MGELQSDDGAQVKRAIIDGRTVNLYAAARAYRVLVIGVAVGFCLPLLSLALANSVYSAAHPLDIFWLLQLCVACTTGWGLYIAGQARGRPPGEYIAVAVFGGLFGMVPIVGLLPAASESGVIHVIMNKLELPVGWFGPSAADIAKLRHGVCHQCGYDLVMLQADRCPECNADIAGEKPAADGFVALVQIDAQAATVHSQRCRRIAAAGLVLCGLQWAIFLLLAIDSAWGVFPVFVLPGVSYGVVAGLASLRAQQSSREYGRADFLVAGLAGMCFPALGAALLLMQARRLTAASARRLADVPVAQPPPSETEDRHKAL